MTQVQNYLTLGDALLSIQEPGDAIKAFQQAIEVDKGKGDATLVFGEWARRAG